MNVSKAGHQRNVSASNTVRRVAAGMKRQQLEMSQQRGPQRQSQLRLIDCQFSTISVDTPRIVPFPDDAPTRMSSKEEEHSSR